MSTIIRGIFSVFRNLLNFLYPEYIHHIGVRAAEPEVSCLAWRERAPVPQDVYVRERDMHHHRTYVPPLRIKVKAVTYPVSSVTWTFAFLSTSVSLICGFFIRVLLPDFICIYAGRKPTSGRTPVTFQKTETGKLLVILYHLYSFPASVMLIVTI